MTEMRPDDPNPNPNPGDGDDDKDAPDNPGTDDSDPDDPDNPGTDDPDPDDQDTPGIDDPDPDEPGTDNPDPEDPDNPGTDDPDPVVPEEIHIGYIPRDEWVQIGSTYYYWIWGTLSACSLPDGGQREDLRWHLITEGIYESQDGDLWITDREYTYEEFSSTIDLTEYPPFLPDFSKPDDNNPDTEDEDSAANDPTDLNDKDIADTDSENRQPDGANDTENKKSERNENVEKTVDLLAEKLKEAGIQIAKDQLEKWVDHFLEKYPPLNTAKNTLEKINAACEPYKTGKQIAEDWAKVTEAQEKADQAGVRNEEVAPFAKKWTSEIAENVYDLLPTEWTDFFLITNDQTGKILGEKAGNWAAGFVNYVQKPAYQQRNILREFGNESPEMSYN